METGKLNGRALVAATVASAVLVARAAVAQHCRQPERSDGTGVSATLRGQAARFERETDPGWYEGVTLGADVDVGVVRGRIQLPYYRLLHPEGVRNGLGDLDTKLEWRLFRDDAWSFGPAIAASFPTGSAEKELGMGHVMLGGSLWAAWQPPEWFLGIEAGYGRALGESSHAEPHEPHAEGSAHSESAHEGEAEWRAASPIPNPMNFDEVWLTARGGRNIVPSTRLTLGALVAAPVSEPGSTRLTLSLGAEFELSRVTTAVGVDVDVLGSTLRRVLSIGASVSY